MPWPTRSIALAACAVTSLFLAAACGGAPGGSEPEESKTVTSALPIPCVGSKCPKPRLSTITVPGTVTAPGRAQVSIANFAPRDVATLYLDDAPWFTIQTDASGNGWSTFDAGTVAVGTHTLWANGRFSSTSYATFARVLPLVAGITWGYAQANQPWRVCEFLQGYGFNEVVDTFLAGSGLLYSVRVDATGSAPLGCFGVPARAPGTYHFEIDGESSGLAQQGSFVVLDPAVTLGGAPSGPAGSTRPFTATGFAPGEDINAQWLDEKLSVWRPIGVIGHTSATGAASGTLVIPELSQGSTVAVFGGVTSGVSAGNVAFTVSGAEATLQLSDGAGVPQSAMAGPPGTTLGVTVHGFLDGETVAIEVLDPSLGNAATTISTRAISSSGLPWWTFPLPQLLGGAYAVRARGVTSGLVTLGPSQLTVTATFTLSASHGPAGTMLTASATGTRYRPVGGCILPEIWFGNDVIKEFDFGADGQGSLTFPVPSDPPGTYTVMLAGCGMPKLTAPFRVD